MGLSVFGSAPAGLVPFDESAPTGDNFKPIEHVGRSVVFVVDGPETVSTKFDPQKSVVRCSKVVLLSPELDGKGEEFANVLIFATAVVDQLKSLAGQTTAATIDTYETKQKSTAPRLAAPSKEAVAAAEKYLAA